MGNKTDVSANDLLLYGEGDPSTDVVLLYLESFGHPRRFSRVAQRVNRKKPIVVVKSGGSQAGGRAGSRPPGGRGPPPAPVLGQAAGGPARGTGRRGLGGQPRGHDRLGQPEQLSG